MRIVIDMQGAQTESRFRGIGRYTMSFAQALVRNIGDHEIILALNGLFPDTIEPIRAAFDGLLPQENIRVWHAPGPVMERQPGNDERRKVAELIREAFLCSLAPDVIHISSIFEGYVDDAVSSIGRFDHATPVSVSLYDLIPLLNAKQYLEANPSFSRYYARKIRYLKQSNVYLAISESTRQESIENLEVPKSRVINISTAIERCFRPLDINEIDTDRLHQKFKIKHPFVLYTGGADERKNLPRLIKAFAALPAKVRSAHQLLLAGKMCESNIAEFKRLAKSAGIKPGELCFAGYVSDKELIELYNSCKLFVFPSWHEGFGLPALEAMACGAPVIGANSSSLPEVIGLSIAMFDPFDVSAITSMMNQALGDHAFCLKLREHSLKQVKQFSWEQSAKRAIAAWESLIGERGISENYISRSLAREKLIRDIAQLIPTSDTDKLTVLAIDLAQNQIAGIERQIMVDISELVQRDSASGVQRVVRSYLKALLHSPPKGFRIEPVYATLSHGYCYARRFTQGFLGKDAAQLSDSQVQWQRGDIFFGLDMQHHVQLKHITFYRQLRSDGVTVKFMVYDLLPIQLVSLFQDSDAKRLHEELLEMIAGTDGAICISKATADDFNNWIDENGICRAPNFQMSWVHIGGDISNSKPSRGMPANAQKILEYIKSRPSFLCVATIEPRKRQQQIIDAIQLLWDKGMDVNLVLVGKQGWNTESLVETIQSHPQKDRRLFWLRGISDEYLELVYHASTCMIAASINEGFGLPLIEAASHEIPIIARDIAVFREVAGECAFYFKGDNPDDLASALQSRFSLYEKGYHPKSSQLQWSTWQESTEKIKKALIQNNYPRRQLLVDISELAQHDAKSGIQRVVRSIIREWTDNPPEGYRIEPVYATIDHGYRYANRISKSYMSCPDIARAGEYIEYAPGDIFLGLDLQPQVVSAHRKFYQFLRSQGVRVRFVVYDLLCVLMPQYFPIGAKDVFIPWLEVITESDGALCISKTVADELAQWLKIKNKNGSKFYKIDWFHLGANVDGSVTTKGFFDDTNCMLDRIFNRDNFLMVGTIEPRKGYAQVLDAFEQLWQSGQDINLVIAGKEGWMVNKFVDRLRSHNEYQKRLFWLQGISDEDLKRVYSYSTCLIAASYGEGFGLPLIEAARHNLPIIARDIPVFREVAGEHAYYFRANAPNELAKAIESWLALYDEKKHPKSDNMHWLTWKESARKLWRVLSKKSRHYRKAAQAYEE